ncbi:hypothetical protein [Ottowia sp. VDI28]|uniref:hypothetical protein n=1 Tax=Ottowia sp. VDI28 TaxID=3133968 RepID=UPI003C2F3F17
MVTRGEPAASGEQTYECKQAIKNASVHSGAAKARDIDDQRAKAASICGYNPWPGPSMTETDAYNKRTQALEKQNNADKWNICTEAGGFANCR